METEDRITLFSRIKIFFDSLDRSNLHNRYWYKYQIALLLPLKQHFFRQWDRGTENVNFDNILGISDKNQALQNVNFYSLSIVKSKVFAPTQFKARRWVKALPYTNGDKSLIAIYSISELFCCEKSCYEVHGAVGRQKIENICHCGFVELCHALMLAWECRGLLRKKHTENLSVWWLDVKQGQYLPVQFHGVLRAVLFPLGSACFISGVLQ